MELRPIDLLGGFYADDSKPWSVQDTVNWLPEVAEVAGTRTQMKLASPPGLREYMRLGDRPIRGLRNVEGQLFAVCGNDLHQISTKATSTVRGQIPGVGRVQMAHNQITGGNELLLVNGQSTGYVWNTANNTYLRITDDGYPGARAADYLDSYLLQVEPFGRFWFHSNLANALDYNTLDRYESEASPDKIVTLVVSQFEVVVFNETTTEFFYNIGANTNTFQNKRVLIDRGCASGDTVQKLDNSVFWLGNDGVVYRLNGYQAVPISTGPVQAAIRDNNWKQAFAFTWEDGKHKVYYLTFPDGKTWGFDVVTGVWHRRQSFGLERWRLNHLVRWNGMWIGSDFQDGRLWVLDWDYMLEGDQPLVSERIGPVGHSNQMGLSVNYAELLMNMGLLSTKLPSELSANYWDSSLVYSTYELSDENKTVEQVIDGVNAGNQRAVSSRSFGKWYFEVQPFGNFENTPTGIYGVGPDGMSPNGGSLGDPGKGAGMGSHGYAFINGAITPRVTPPYPGNSRCMVAYDADSGDIYFGANGEWYGDGSPGDGVSPFANLLMSPAWPMVSLAQIGAGYTIHTLKSECLYAAPAGFSPWGNSESPIQSNGAIDDRKVEVCYSKDGGYNWENWREYSLGEVGEYQRRIRMNRFGRGRNWVFRIRVSSPVKRDLYGAVAYIEPTGG